MLRNPVTPDLIRLVVSGLFAGSAVGLLWRAAGRTRWGATPFVVAVLAAAHHTGQLEWPAWSAVVAAGGIATLLAGVGAARILKHTATHWAWLAAGAVIAAVGVWAGVPETGPALVVGAAISGLAMTSALTAARWSPRAGLGLAAVVGWAALSGAAGRPWATVGGALCTGLAPWLGLQPPRQNRGQALRPWLLVAHMGLVLLAARWIGIQPRAGWDRVAVVAVAGSAVAWVSRRRHD